MESTQPFDLTDAEGRYVVDETYDGNLVIRDRENETAWIHSDVVWALER